jgi:hypothetical protein
MDNGIPTKEFEGKLARGMAVSSGFVVPFGLLLSGISGGWRGLVGALVGFSVAALHSIAVITILRWALSKPPGLLTTIIMSSYFARLLLLAGILYGLTLIKGLNVIAMLSCFLALYLAHTTVEVLVAWKSLGMSLRPPGG